jgi:hypothetical protein
VSSDHPAKNRVKNVHESRRANQGYRIHLGFYEQESGEIAEQVIEIHWEALTLAFYT